MDFDNKPNEKQRTYSRSEQKNTAPAAPYVADHGVPPAPAVDGNGKGSQAALLAALGNYAEGLPVTASQGGLTTMSPGEGLDSLGKSAHSAVQRMDEDQRILAGGGGGGGGGGFLNLIETLEQLAIQDGYALTERITAFRKVFYDSAPSYSGGAWNLLIPGAAKTPLPPSWMTGQGAILVTQLKGQKVQNINGSLVDIGHLLAGLDAGNHQQQLDLAGGVVHMRSNKEATTFTGDLGSVVAEYLHGSKKSFYDVARKRPTQAELGSVYDDFAATADMAGNADAYALKLDQSKTLTENLQAYYYSKQGGASKRYSGFARAIGLGSPNGGKLAGDNQGWRQTMTEQTFEAALAYAAAKGWTADVVNVLSDPGPGTTIDLPLVGDIGSPTFWEAYDNVSGWVVDLFVERVTKDVISE